MVLKIGENGIRLSGGEKHHTLMARAIYKAPDYFFLNEATSSLDSVNEKGILNNLNSFNKNRTVVIVAHGLSTADNIIVLDNGTVKEQGTHQGLLGKKGDDVYYSVYVEMPHLKTTYGKEIEFKQEMMGTAKIVLQEASLLERVFYQFRGLWSDISY